MKIVLLLVSEEPDSKLLSIIIDNSLYDYYSHHNFNVYTVSLDDPAADAAKLAVVDDYDPEFLILVLRRGRSIEDIPADYQSKIWQEIKITGKGE